ATRRCSAGPATRRSRASATSTRARPIPPSSSRSPRRCRCGSHSIRPTSISASGTRPPRCARTSRATWRRRSRCSGTWRRRGAEPGAVLYRYIARRLLATIPVMAVVAVLVFLLLRLTTGDPAAIIAGDNATAPQVEAIRAKLGLDRPVAQQFVIWIGDIARGDLGESFFFKKPVTALIADRIEPTAALAVCTIVLAVLLAVPLGVTAAYRRGRWIGRLGLGGSGLGVSLAAFLRR